MMQRTSSPDKVKPDLGDNHDEVKERQLMKRKMDARRKAEKLLKTERELKEWFEG